MSLYHRIDSFVGWIGRVLSWLNGVLIIVIILQVILRYVFGHGLVMLEELEWHLYAVGIMMGLSYGVTRDSHIRLDLLSGNFSQKRKSVIDSVGHLLFLLPFIIVIVLQGYDYSYQSWRLSEQSTAPLGIHWRWAIKGMIPISFLVFGLSVISRMLRALQITFGKK